MQFVLNFRGNEASSGELDFYDAARAVMGFQRSLALTTHFVINGEIITQAPALKNARIMVRPPSVGSWEIVAAVGIGLYTLGATSKDTVLGHLLRSAYDYVISNTLGFHVDFDKSLGQQHKEFLQANGKNDVSPMSEGRLDALMEKVESAIIDIHRPIVMSETAATAQISDQRGSELIGKIFTADSYAYASEVKRLTKPEQFVGVVSSYNVNTFKGRIYIAEEQRPVPFMLADRVRGRRDVNLVVSSLRSNAVERASNQAPITITAFRDATSAGRTKSLFVTEIAGF
jgi:hypothetical protein